MTPFDPDALLAMLRAFYQPATVANLRRARAERPEYFAGGELFGTHGEKFRLPDGRIFDLIFDVDGPEARYQVIDVTHGGDSGDPTFALEPGALTPIDVDRLDVPTLAPYFETRLGHAAGELGDPDSALGDRERELASGDTGAGLDAAYGELIEPASEEIDSQRAAWHDLDIGLVAEQTSGQRDAAGANDREYADPNSGPPDREIPDPGEIPPVGGGDNIPRPPREQ